MNILHCLNVTGLSREELQDSILLQNSIMLLNPYTDCDGFGKRFLVPHDLSCPKGGLFMERHINTSEEWGALSAQVINPLYILYKPKPIVGPYRLRGTGLECRSRREVRAGK